MYIEKLETVRAASMMPLRKRVSKLINRVQPHR
jgi:hypothetical protein